MNYKQIFDKYEITKQGNVIRKKTGLVLSKSKVGKARKYLQVTLTFDGVPSTHRVHRLVATKYIKNPDNKPQVNHKDGNTFNNNVDNLEWVTAQENINHALSSGLYKHKKPSKLVTCANCGKQFRKMQSVLDMGYGKFCSRKCFGIDRQHNPNTGMYGYKSGKYALKEYCIRGHLRSETSTANGDCRLCSRIRAMEWRATKNSRRSKLNV